MDKNLSLLLRISLAFAFLYPAVSALVTPFAWLGYFPSFMLDMFAGREELLLHTFGITEVVIALWLLWGKKLWLVSAIASAYLLGIILFNIPQMDVIFRDISILGIAVALFWDDWRKRSTTSPPRPSL